VIEETSWSTRQVPSAYVDVIEPVDVRQGLDLGEAIGLVVLHLVELGSQLTSDHDVEVAARLRRGRDEPTHGRDRLEGRRLIRARAQGLGQLGDRDPAVGLGEREQVDDELTIPGLEDPVRRREIGEEDVLGERKKPHPARRLDDLFFFRRIGHPSLLPSCDLKHASRPGTVATG
jgi:hypothetical protein